MTEYFHERVSFLRSLSIIGNPENPENDENSENSENCLGLQEISSLFNCPIRFEYKVGYSFDFLFFVH
jgi:hypothetical protein